MSAVGNHLRLRLFLEGVEIPVIAASITSQKNAAAMCSIQIPANDYALDFKPRTLVHLFSYDSYRGAPPEQQVWVGGAGLDVKNRFRTDPDQGSKIPTEASPVQSPELTMVDLENDNYKLIFGGEVIGISYQKTPASRCMALQCIDWSSYWDIAYQYQVSGMSLGGGGIKAAFTAANTTVFNDMLEGSGDIVLKLLSTAPRSYPKLKGSLLGGIMHLIEAIGGCYFGKNAVKGTNDFFSLAEMRLHLTQMVGANPASASDELRLLHANGFGSLFSKALGGLGKLVTIRQVLLALQRYIFHEIVPITAPYFIPPQADPNTVQSEAVPISADTATAPLARSAQSLKARALEILGRQDQSTTLQVSETQSAARGGLQKELLGLAGVATEAQRTARKVALRHGGSPANNGLSQVSAAFETATRQFVAVLGACRYGTTGTYRFPLANTSAAQRVRQTLQAIADSMQQVLEAKYTRPANRAMSQPDPPPRLLTQIYRPDVWMVAPPRCNVIFPELYSQFSYGRNFLNEVSRMLLRTNEAFYGSDILFDGFYMAPSRLLGARKGKKIGTGRVGIDPPDLSDAPAWVVKDMLDHELYTGITPSFERMSDLNLHAIRGGSTMINGAKVGYAQLACNHIFFQYRFKARELMCSGKFNPYAVLGFPMVIIDKYTSDDQLQGEYDPKVARRLAESFLSLPHTEQQNIVEVTGSRLSTLQAEISADRPQTHYLGTPELISHNISAESGGTTQYQMSYARTTNEKTEFLGDNVGRSAKAKLKKNVKPYNIVAALEPPRVGSKGPLGGKISEVTEVTSQYQRSKPKKTSAKASTTASYASSTLLPLFVGGRNYAGRERKGTRVPVGVELPATAYGSEVVALAGSGGRAVAGSGDVLVTFLAFRIVEEVGSYEAHDVELPPEELAFPPWYGDDYRTTRIGGLYSRFFGIGSITDPTVVVGSIAPQSVADDAKRALYVQFESTFGSDQLPVPGFSSTPEPTGGGSIGPAGDPDILGEVEARSPIADAVTEIVRIYSATRTQHYDTPAFVNNYCWRPIASIVDMFGTADLQITDSGVVTAGREGFHSRSFGDFDDLRQLVGPGANGLPQRVLGLEAAPSEISADQVDPSAKIAARLDTRKEKRLAVLRYLAALAASRGVLLG
jgi:hypothetical protein